MTDIMTKTDIQLRVKGNWAVYYTSPLKFYNNLFLFVVLTILGTLVNFVGCFSVQALQPLILNKRKGRLNIDFFVGRFLIL